MIKTVLHFDYGGCYVETEEGFQWNSKNATSYRITFKTSSIEDISYTILVEKIHKKLGMDEDTKIKLSYMPLSVEAKKQSYIFDDDDVEIYLCSMTIGQLRSFLHVEVNEDLILGLGSLLGRNYDANNAITIYEQEKEHDAPPLEIIGVGDVNMIHVDNASGELALNEYVVEGDGYGFNESIEMSCDRQDEDTQFLQEWEDDTSIELGQEFVTKQQVQDLIFRASHKRSYDYDVVNSDTSRYVVRCRQKGCKWYLRVSRPPHNQGSWSVKVYRRLHSCSRVTASTSNVKRRGSADLVASVVRDDYPGQFDTPSAKSLISFVQGKVGVIVSYSTALRGKKKAANVMRGSPEDCYKMLYSYLFVLEKTNIGTVTRLVTDDEALFKYLFVALGACIEGFRAMRKVLCVDATFLKTVYHVVLIFATAQDPNHHHYPIAFAVVDGEKDASWNWFFTMLKTVVPDDPKLFLTLVFNIWSDSCV